MFFICLKWYKWCLNHTNVDYKCLNDTNEILIIKVLKENIGETSSMNLEHENNFLTMTQNPKSKRKYLYIKLESILKFWLKK